MPGTARRVTIVVLLALMVVLAIVAFFIWNNARNAGRTNIAVDGEACPAGSAPQCQAGQSGNTGKICNCTQNGTAFRWDCATTDTNRCPVAGSATCQPGEQQAGACGANGCDPSEKPVQTCSADGTFGPVVCVADNTCTGSSTSSATSSTSSTTSSTSACSIITGDGALTIGSACDTDFSYQIRKYVITAPLNATDASCATVEFDAPELVVGTPGATYDVAEESCGQCVKFELLEAPEGADVDDTTIVGFSGTCAVSSSSSSVTSSAVSSDDSDTLPDTGLFDDPSNRPLVIGLGLILLGLMANRLWRIPANLWRETAS